MQTPTHAFDLMMVEARSVAIAVYIHTRLEAAGQPCERDHYTRRTRGSLDMSSLCAEAEHEYCIGRPTSTALGLPFSCKCLCHQAQPQLAVIR